jgi:hypothetical protein
MYSSYFLRIFSTLEVISPGVSFLGVTASPSYRHEPPLSTNRRFPASP